MEIGAIITLIVIIGGICISNMTNTDCEQNNTSEQEKKHLSDYE